MEIAWDFDHCKAPNIVSNLQYKPDPTPLASQNRTMEKNINDNLESKWMIIARRSDGGFPKRVRDCDITPDIKIKFQNTTWEFYLELLKQRHG